MATHAHSALSDRARGRTIAVAGIAIIALSAGAALLPAEKGASSDIIGALLVAAGLVETLAGSLRRQVRSWSMAAGIVTAIAGLLFILNPETHFFPTVTLIIGWLLIRCLVLAYGSSCSAGSVRTWMAISAGMDFLLGILLITGLSVATLVVSVFGPTQPLVAGFAWVLALSFVITGALQLEVASSERQNAAA